MIDENTEISKTFLLLLIIDVDRFFKPGFNINSKCGLVHFVIVNFKFVAGRTEMKS